MSEHTSPAPDLIRKDFHLELVLDSVLGYKDEKHENSFGLSLVTSGGIISGTAHTRYAWVKGQIDRLTTAGGEGAQFLASVLQIVEGRLFGDNDDGETDDSTGLTRGYINLKNARVISGGSIVNYEWLRVDMSQIVAWNLSSHDQSESV